MRRNLQRREEIGKKGGKVKKWVLKFSFSSPLRPFSCSLCSLERGAGKINKIKGKGEEKEGPRAGKGGSFYITNIYSLYESDKLFGNISLL